VWKLKDSILIRNVNEKRAIMRMVILGLLFLTAVDQLGDRWFDYQDRQEAQANAKIQLAGQ
jgi:hypothetical protein